MLFRSVCICRDDDDINDVASMAGVNRSEESARILATNSDVVGAVTRSCQDEAFLSSALLQRRILDIGLAVMPKLSVLQHMTANRCGRCGRCNIEDVYMMLSTFYNILVFIF